MYHIKNSSHILVCYTVLIIAFVQIRNFFEVEWNYISYRALHRAIKWLWYPTRFLMSKKGAPYRSGAGERNERSSVLPTVDWWKLRRLNDGKTE